MKGGGVVGDEGFLTIFCPDGQLVVVDPVLRENAFDRRGGEFGIREELFAVRAQQFSAGTSGEGHHFIVDVGDNSLRVGHHEGIDARLDQGV